MHLTIADFILHRLKQLGCRHVFGIPGTSCAGLFEAIEQTDGISYVLTVNELEAGYLADGYGRHGSIGATCVSYGVGTLSLANAVASGLTERVPMIVLNGGPTENDLQIEDEFGVLFPHSTGRRDTDLKVFNELCVAAKRLTDLSQMETEIDRLLNASIAECGPVYLEVPQNYWSEVISVTNLEWKVNSAVTSRPQLNELIKRLEERLAQSTSPILLLGSEIARRGLAEGVLAIINQWKIPFCTTLLSKSIISEEHKLFAGVYDSDLAPKAVRKTVEDADVVLALGCIYGIDHRFMVKKQYEKMVDISFGQGRVGSVKFTPIHLQDTIDALQTLCWVAPAHLGEKIESALIFETKRDRLKSQARKPEMLGHESIFQCVKDYLLATEEEIYVGVDTCLASYPGADLPLLKPETYLCNPVWLSIGQGTPATIGAYFATGKRPLIITGDGGFQMVASSISTMVVHQIPAIIIVIDNGTYAIEQFLIDGQYFLDPDHKPLNYAKLNAWKYELLPQVYNGSNGFRVETIKELQTALSATKSIHDGPTVIACTVSPRDLPNENWTYLEENS